MSKNKKTKIAVALSGGVDSSVAAALLKKQGFEVVGFHMRLWQAVPDKKQQAEIEKRVKETCRILDIKVFIFDFKKEFKNSVVDYFIDSYKKGITPNPCVVCNAAVKFGLLLEKAKEMKCNYLSTGHYARIKRCQLPTANYKLLRAKDRNKDQTYFLWKLGQKQLARVLFPVGGIESKQKVRELAKEFGLPTFATPESNDVCFLQGMNIQNFLKQIYPEGCPRGSGDIVDVKGQILGKHSGFWFYTIGQRKGIFLPGGPWYVVAKDVKKNTLIVSNDEKDSLRKELVCEGVNWISGAEPRLPLKISAKIRYKNDSDAAIIAEKTGPKKYRIVFAQPQRAITPGQSVVFYRGEELLGGGVIS
ncbi:MAG: tRNA 2-thiouridine(34) synthase MnmA [Patescibacteria group bacterium]|nr:tRNA 2-thiouridine(34) synthase MnmA [Patescibacteria group bacterium]